MNKKLALRLAAANLKRKKLAKKQAKAAFAESYKFNTVIRGKTFRTPFMDWHFEDGLSKGWGL